MKRIAVLSGDGIGPEIMRQAIKSLNVVSEISNVGFQFTEGLIGGAAYKEAETHFPEATKTLCQNSDAVLFGSVGGPVEAAADVNHPEHLVWKDAEKNSLLGLRKQFNFAVNLRPCKIYPDLQHLSPLKSHIVDKNVDFVIVRELVGDVYFGKHFTAEDGKSALDEMAYTEEEIRRPVDFTFKTVLSGESTRKVTIVDKANVLDTSRLWRTVTNRAYGELTKEEREKIDLGFMFVDNAAMQLILNPGQFEFLVTANLFGDILSDAASVIPGSLGLMPSASLSNTGFHMYEPSGGSAPTIANQDIANPIGQILSAAMMLEYSFGMAREKQLIEKSVESVLKEGYRTSDLFTEQAGERLIGTSEMGSLISSGIRKLV